MKKTIKLLNSTDGYNLAALFYDHKEKYLNSFEQDRVLSLLRDIKNLKILDVGAGTGRLASGLAKRGADVVALDLSEKMLAVLKKKNGAIKIVVGDAENLPFKNEAFDIVVAAFLIVHLKNPIRFFDEAYRVLKDGGCFIVTNINQKNPPLVKTKHGDILIESFYHRPEKIKEILESLAFGIEEEIFVEENGKWVNQILVARK